MTPEEHEHIEKITTKFRDRLRVLREENKSLKGQVKALNKIVGNRKQHKIQVKHY